MKYTFEPADSVFGSLQTYLLLPSLTSDPKDTDKGEQINYGSRVEQPATDA